MASAGSNLFKGLCTALFPFLTYGASWMQQNSTQNSTLSNPILPGFHPDPSCIFVPEWNSTFFCASSSFNAFPGIPIHASKDLQNWKLIGNVINRKEQLPSLAYTNSSTSGIWAPTIRYHEGTFWLVTTLVFDDSRPDNDSSRWDNIIFKSTDPYSPASWSDAVHFDFFGYDTSPFWDADGRSYIVGSHFYSVYPSLDLAPADLDTGAIGEWQSLWNGTGAHAPEGPHLYLKDGWYYLLVAEGGTGVGHMVSVARSRSLAGPYEADPANPELTNANTSAYFQTVGHADLFQDLEDRWWGVALATRSGPEHVYYPMGRETVMTAVTWIEGEFPVWTAVGGNETVWALPPPDKDVAGAGPFIDEGDDIDFAPGTALPAHFTYWRYPNQSTFAVSPEGHPNTLRVRPSMLNLTGHDGTSAPDGLPFVGRRQQDTLFTYSVHLDYNPSAHGEEAGISVFLTQDHHLDLGLVVLPANESTTTLFDTNTTAAGDPSVPIPQIRFRGTSSRAVPDPVIAPLPKEWSDSPLILEIKAVNTTHYSFAVGRVEDESNRQMIAYASNDAVSYGFTGTFVGVYCTSNGGGGSTSAHFSKWRYIPQGQYRE